MIKNIYGVLFTCAATHAFYLDIALDYLTEAVLYIICRLKAIRVKKGWNEDVKFVAAKIKDKTSL